ncbi:MULTISPECIES: HpcH/HpaI aldolase/citrate lyase family protein [Methylobacterium]|uniref:HpcH/HpaI aldolase/citrate lyase family protein n=1 Tax=Methylobacterium TaxID=407 RepID=UPI0013EC0440|nr:CoA ester lyase [Methylobacterium sp. DB0501]NGM37452.1 CoA ester lyase [Methylobacterium sp. DB0501]
MPRPIAARRTWIFAAGADETALRRAAEARPDVLIQDLEDFTPPQLKREARLLCRPTADLCREAGVIPAVRVNPLEHVGHEDLAAAMQAGAGVILLAKTAGPEQIAALDRAVTRHERDLGLAVGSTEIVPNVETAAALVRIAALAEASSRVTAMLMASEDMAADLGVGRTAGSEELAYARARFLFECVAAGVLAIDCPYTFSRREDIDRDLDFAVARGFKAKALVDPAQVAHVNARLTPSEAQMTAARRLISAFEQARTEGRTPAELDGHRIEVPSYKAALRLLERAAVLGVALPASES